MKPPKIASPLTGGRSRILTRCAFVAIAIAGPLLCLSWLTDLLASSPGPLDLRVYRDIAASWMGGADLYDARVTEVGLPFTYPPFAAVLFAPLAAIPLPIAITLWSIACLVCVYAVVWWSYQESPVAPLAFFAVTGALMASAPVWDTVAFGQVNLFILALACADFLRTRNRFRGVLVGVAASIKITPVFLLLLPLLRRDWTTIARAIGTIALIAVTVGVLFPQESLAYFGSILWDTSRPGSMEYVANQSLTGLLSRTDHYSTIVWLALCAVVVTCAIVIATGSSGRSRVVSLLTVAIAGLLVSPISWSHHWVWICLGPAAAVFLWRHQFRAEAIATVLLTTVIGFWKPYTLLYATWEPEDQPLRWLLESNLYTWAALAWLVSLATLSLMARWRNRTASKEANQHTQ